MATCGECAHYAPDSYEDGQEPLAFVPTGWCVDEQAEWAVRADDPACDHFEPKEAEDGR